MWHVFDSLAQWRNNKFIPFRAFANNYLITLIRGMQINRFTMLRNKMVKSR